MLKTKRIVVKKRLFIPVHFLMLFCLFLLADGCRSRDNLIPTNKREGAICAILAHPDDETIISGTLAKLTDLGFEIYVVYATSGDDGPDQTGLGLHGSNLAQVREAEVVNALRSIEIDIPPIFLKYPDSHVHENIDSLQNDLLSILDNIGPDIIIGFGPDGITGDWDHISTGLATDSVFGQMDKCRLLLHMVITKPLPPFYANGVPVSKDNVDLCVNVSKYHRQRAQVVEAHHTQFNSRVRSSYKILVHTMRKEKFIVAANRSGDEWLELLCIKACITT